MPQPFVSAVVISLVACTATPAFAGRHRHIDDNDTVTLRGNTHPRAFREAPTGVADPSLRMQHMVLSLAVTADKEAKLHDLLTTQQDPESTQYHRWLSPEEFARQFGQSQENLKTVTDWLKSHGFTVEEVSKSGTSITFSGTAAQVRRAFHTDIYEYRVNGRTHHSNTCDPSIPRELADLVTGVVSLHSFPRQPMHHGARRVTPQEKSALYTGGGSAHYISPADFATIYNLNPLYQAGIDGTGQTIAIVGRTHPSSSNWASFRSAMGLPAKAVEVIVNGADPGSLGGSEDLEADLDVEWAGAVAKNATIKFVTSKSTNVSDGVDLSASYIVNNNLAPVMSVSFGQCEAYMGATENAFYNNLWKQAAAQGITVLVASGDSGAAGCEPSAAASGSVAAVSGMASTPYNVAVGGTQFNEGTGSYWSGTNGAGYSSATGYIPEKAWNESGSGGLMATGGGMSSLYAKPSWQVAPGVPSDGKRDVPDVSLSAAGHDGYLIYTGGGLSSCGGTSASAPAFAGLMALVVQATGQRQGNANLRLYQLAAEQMNSGGAGVFHDIITGSNSVPGVSGFPATNGYDLATGLGSVDATAMVQNWQQNSQSDPLITSTFAVPAVSKSTVVPVSEWTTSGTGTVTGYLITTSSAVPAPTAVGWSASRPASYNVGSQGTKTLYAWIKNSYGAVSPPATATVNVDMTAPTVTSFASAPVVNSGTIPLTLTASDDNSGVSGYAVTESSTAPAASSSVWSASVPTSYTAAASGTKTLYAWVKDAAGNVSKSLKSATVIDTARPSVSSFKVPAAANTLTIAISAFSGSDNIKVAAFQVTEAAEAPAAEGGNWSATAPVGYTFSSPGVKTLYPWVRDSAGNVSLPKPVTLQIDTAAPTVSSFTMANPSRTLATAVTALGAADDVKVAAYLITETPEVPALSDKRWSAKAPASYTFAVPGAKTVYAWAKDAVGNISASVAATTLVDTSAPTVAAFAVPPVGNSLTVAISQFSAADNVAVTGYLVTEAASAPSLANANWSATPAASFTFASAGTKTLRAWVRDDAGNVSAAKTATTVVDLTPPVVGSFTAPAAANSLAVPIKVTATDAVKVAAFLVGESADPPAADAVGWSATAPTGYTFASAGSKTLYAWAKDSAGNISKARTAVTVVDTTLPAVDSFALPETSKTLAVPFGSFAVSDNVKVVGWLVKETAGAPEAGAKEWKGAAPASFTFATQGAKTLYAWVKDAAGNVSPSASATVLVDTGVPAVSSFVLPSNSNSLTVAVTAFTASDNVTVAGYLLTDSSAKPAATDSRWSASPVADYTFASAGSKTLFAWAKDEAGNVSAARSAAVTVDIIAPTVKAFSVPAKSTSLSVAISGLSVSDNVRVAAYLATETPEVPAAGNAGWSGVAPKTYTFSSAGEKTLYLWVKDGAGNVSAVKGAPCVVGG